MYSYVIAVGENNEMGLNNKLPWRIPNDVKYFRAVTEFHTMIMGRKTFESLPRVLPNRHHIVLTRDKEYTYKHKDVTVVHSLNDLFAITSSHDEYFVIGGSQIFDLLLPYTERIYLTVVHGTFEADTYFTQLDMDDWIITKEWDGVVDENNKLPQTFYILDKKTKE